MLKPLLDRMLGAIGVSPETASTAARGIAAGVSDELKLIAGDLAAATVRRYVRAQLRPHLEALRAELLSAIAGEMPAGFAERLRSQGYNELSDEQIELLWTTCVASIAEKPATAAAA